jgi:RNase H-fold protein (predicted Holliday junction resolvase)
VRKFAGKLHTSLTIPVEFENEVFTTRMAESTGVKKEHADDVAAAIILQSFLDKENR